MSSDAGLLTLFALVFADSLGVPAPGDSALIVAGALVADGRVSLMAVIAVASAAAIIGDTIVYGVGRFGGRRILLRDGRFAQHRRRAVAKADAFYARHGLAAVFLGKFVPGVRGVGAFVAGTSGMRWGAFALVNAAACVTWTSLAVTVGYALGPALILAVVVGVLVLTGLAWGLRHFGARAREQADAIALEPGSPGSPVG